MEIWSFTHDWTEGIWPWGLHRVPLRLMDPARWLNGPATETLKRWDRIGSKRRFVGIGSLDAHEFGLPMMTWPPASFERVFGTVRTHIRAQKLTRDKEHDLRAVRTAIEEGRCHVANDLLCDSTGFDFWGELPSGELVLMGEEAPYRSGMELHVRCPVPGDWRAPRWRPDRGENGL